VRELIEVVGREVLAPVRIGEGVMLGVIGWLSGRPECITRQKFSALRIWSIWRMWCGDREVRRDWSGGWVGRERRRGVGLEAEAMVNGEC